MNSKPAKPLSAEKFYDAASDFYEQMIDFEKNMELRISAYKNIFPQTCVIADLGCGIGLDSIALAKNGHTVTAFDVSSQMIETAKLNAKKYNTEIEFKINSISALPKKYKNKFNSVVCVGNTVAHLNAYNLSSALERIYGLLMPGGKLFIHILNYKKIIAENKRINNIANREGKTIIRFYDFFNDLIRFNILTFDTARPKDFQLISTKHFPHSQKKLLAVLKNAGFSKLKCYGNFALQKYLSSESKDLFIEAIK